MFGKDKNTETETINTVLTNVVVRIGLGVQIPSPAIKNILSETEALTRSMANKRGLFSLTGCAFFLKMLIQCCHINKTVTALIADHPARMLLFPFLRRVTTRVRIRFHHFTFFFSSILSIKPISPFL